MKSFILKGMNPDSHVRFQSMSELKAQLEEVITTGKIAANGNVRKAG
jgi:hypothetical protein